MGISVVSDMLNSRNRVIVGAAHGGRRINNKVSGSVHSILDALQWLFLLCSMEERDKFIIGYACSMQKNNNIYEENILFFISIGFILIEYRLQLPLLSV